MTMTDKDIAAPIEEHGSTDPNAFYRFVFENDRAQRPSLEEVADQLNPENFYSLLEHTIGMDDETAAIEGIQTFAAYAEAPFREVTIPEESITPLTNKIETDISDFINENKAITGLHLVGPTEFVQLTAMFNRQNLLYFAKHLIEANELQATIDDIDQIYRYRTVIKRLSDIGVRFSLMSEEDVVFSKSTYGWAGGVHPYGYDEGVINPAEHRSFSEQEETSTLDRGYINYRGLMVRSAVSINEIHER